MGLEIKHEITPSGVFTEVVDGDVHVANFRSREDAELFVIAKEGANRAWAAIVGQAIPLEELKARSEKMMREAAEDFDKYVVEPSVREMTFTAESNPIKGPIGVGLPEPDAIVEVK